MLLLQQSASMARDEHLKRKLVLAAVGIAAIAVAIALNVPASQAQSPSVTDQPVSYVASIKPNNAIDARSFSEYSAGGRFTATAVTVGSLLRIAYRIQPYQLVGLPGWITARRY